MYRLGNNEYNTLAEYRSACIKLLDDYMSLPGVPHDVKIAWNHGVRGMLVLRRDDDD